METIAASPYPQNQTSHLRSSQYTNPAATRQVQPPDSLQPTLSAPASQDSLASYQSVASASTGPRLHTSSSNISQLTAYTDVASPTLPSARDQQHRYDAPSKPMSERVQTPDDSDADRTTPDDSAITSPMSLTSPISTTNGTKRTASGHVKYAPSLPNTPLASTFAATQRPRADSISSTGSRASELAKDLKTRLGYAMAKVHNGWEHHNIHEVEQLAAHKVYAPYQPSHRHSMSHVESSRRPKSSGWSTTATTSGPVYDDGYSYAKSPYIQSQPTNGESAYQQQYPSKRHSTTFYASSSQPTLSTAPALQPAADIRPGQTNFHYDYNNTHPISLSQPTYAPSAMSPPRTPVNGHTRNYSHASRTRRPTTLRTDTQTAEAEKEALEALFQLGSPHAGARFQDSRASSGDGVGGMGMMTTPRRVTFQRTESDDSAGSGIGGVDGREA